MDAFHLKVGDGPLAAAAIHDGHCVRDSAARLLAIDEASRLREEDPLTGRLARLAPTCIVAARSRFEVDLNRPRDQAVYRTPEEAWGLDVWKESPTLHTIGDSLQQYDWFFATVRTTLRQMVAVYERVVVLDIHTYNHRRDGAGAPAADPKANPEVNIGTGSVDRRIWTPLVDRFIGGLRRCEIAGRPLDARENVKFQGGHFPRWINATFPGSVCAIAVEFKKTFMNEWTGEVDEGHFSQLERALASTFPGVLAELRDLPSAHRG